MDLPPNTGDRQHRDDVIRVTALTVNTNEIVGETFSNCRILGPAVLVPFDSAFLHCVWDGTPDQVFWEIPPDRTAVIGAVAVRDCTFSRCSFQQIGLAGAAELRSMMEAAFTAD